MGHILTYTKQDLRLLPNQPGVYEFYDACGQLIYVGKAKSIAKRVKSYFTQKHQVDPKTRRLVEKIHTISLVLVNNEYEALLLENNLIKQVQPLYNILLKDSKTYPYLCITEERFPRLVVTRHQDKIKGTYYGPFVNSKAMHSILELIKSLYKLRTCTYKLSPKNISQKKFKVCLEYHLGNCQGPCEGLQDHDSYQQDIAEVSQLLSGSFRAVKKALKARMQEAAGRLDFEGAQIYKERLEALGRYYTKSLITHPSLGNLDVFGMVPGEDVAFVHYLRVNEGMVVCAQTLEVQKKLGEADSHVLALAICHFKAQHNSKAQEILTNIPVEIALPVQKVTVPKIGDKKKLVDLALKNALFFKQEQVNKQVITSQQSTVALQALQECLHLKKLPRHIECFDNSNLQGNYPVAAMVCFKDGQPARAHYRRFHIKTVTGINDVASMREVVARRYQKLLQTQQPLPDLIVIDGGRGQLNAAVSALNHLGIQDQVAVISLAKRLDTVYSPQDAEPLYLSKQSPALRLLQHVSSEVHRFAHSFHQQTRQKNAFKNRLQDIPGIGPKTTAKLLKHFGALRIQTATEAELATHIGTQKATLLRAYLQGK